MRESQRSPVFCDNCPNLAVARLEGAPLCMRCLRLSLESCGVTVVEMLDEIEPLYSTSQPAGESATPKP